MRQRFALQLLYIFAIHTTTLLASAAHGKLHQMLHERLQRDVIGEDGLRALTYTAVATSRVRGAGVEFAKQEAGLRATSVTDNEARKWEAILDEFLVGVLALKL